MKLQRLRVSPPFSSIKPELPSSNSRYISQGANELKLNGDDFTTKLLDRRWALPNPDAKVHQIILSDKTIREGGELFDGISFVNNIHPSFGDEMIKKNDSASSFYVVRDDLLHPFVNGNKARKLDGLLPLIEDSSITDVVTCGGCQSAHAAAVAVACAERGLTSHLLLRGEQPEILTGYNLVSTVYGNVIYVPRSLYAKREEMLKSHADLVAGTDGSVVWFSDILKTSFSAPTYDKLNSEQKNVHSITRDGPRKTVIVNEGAGDTVALLGVIRLVRYLAQAHLFGKDRALEIVVDAGTGTTATGLGLGAIILGLPWKVTAIMLADTIDGYREQEKRLVSDFKRSCAYNLDGDVLDKLDGGLVQWVERTHPRKFGNVLKGEVEECQRIAQQTGILVDPVYTLSAWALATLLSQKYRKEDAKVVMVHTGGTLGLFGLAQRYKSYFQAL